MELQEPLGQAQQASLGSETWCTALAVEGSILERPGPLPMFFVENLSQGLEQEQCSQEHHYGQVVMQGRTAAGAIPVSAPRLSLVTLL